MEATIKNFRQGRHHQQTTHLIIVANEITSKEDADKLVDKSVSWKNEQGTEIKGKIASAHGNSGAIRVIFERGLPGQAVGTKVQIE